MRDLAAATPDLMTTFKSLNYLLNELAYNPPGAKKEGYLFWLSWANHLGADDLLHPGRAGPDPPRPRGLRLLDRLACSTRSPPSNPQLGTLVDLLNGPNRTGICPYVVPGAGRADG